MSEKTNVKQTKFKWEKNTFLNLRKIMFVEWLINAKKVLTKLVENIILRKLM